MDVRLIPEKCLWDEVSPATVSTFEISERSNEKVIDSFDVVIIGAGFTGLWTAYYLHLNDPSLHIAIVEKNSVGYGASGRNGGWCSTIMPMSLDSIARQHGKDQAVNMQNAMFGTLKEIKSQIEGLDIACDFALGGSVEILRSPIQVQRSQKHVDNLRSYGFDDNYYQLLNPIDASEIVNAQGVCGALLDKQSAVLHPKKLCLGLARAVEDQGTQIFENLEVLSYSNGEVLTSRHILKARCVLRTTEAFSVKFEESKRSVIPLYSMMIATEPLTAHVWERIGLKNRTTFNDGRNMIIYGQRTADDRIAFGGRGAPYHFGSTIKRDFDFNQNVAKRLYKTLVEMFPILTNVEITHHWGGPLAAPRDWTFAVHFNPETGLGSAGGYVGDGVASSNLAGRTLADLVCGRSSDLTRLPTVNHRSRKWEPEPLRFTAVNALTQLAMLADWQEAKTGRPAKAISALIEKLTSG